LISRSNGERTASTNRIPNGDIAALPSATLALQGSRSGPVGGPAGAVGR